MLTQEQQEVLQKLQWLLEDATERGVLDKLLEECDSPDSINDFSDAVDRLIARNDPNNKTVIA